MGNMGGHEIMPNGKRIPMSKIIIQAQVCSLFRYFNDEWD